DIALVPGDPSPTASLDPENRVAIFRFHEEAELNPQLVNAPNEVKDLFRLLRQIVQLRAEPRQRLHQANELVTVLLEEFTPILECETPFAGRQQCEEELRTLPQAASRALYRG